jgi:hypothetical protein
MRTGKRDPWFLDESGSGAGLGAIVSRAEARLCSVTMHTLCCFCGDGGMTSEPLMFPEAFLDILRPGCLSAQEFCLNC